MSIYRFLADGVVVVHATYVALVVLGLPIIWIGSLAGWSWVRNPWLRLVHLAMIAIVVVESLSGVTCPLTTWEYQLRTQAGETAQAGTFVGRWAHELIFLDGPPWFFTVSYCVFGLLVGATIVLVRPRWLELRRNRRILVQPNREP